MDGAVEQYVDVLEGHPLLVGGDQSVEAGEIGVLRCGGVQMAQVGLDLLRVQRIHAGRLHDDDAWMLADAV
ncbi:hypothetical protein D3C84_1063880 [compost metagenome]